VQIEKYDELNKEYREAGEKAGVENDWDEQLEPRKTVETGEMSLEMEEEKSFKPRIRLEKKRFSKTIIIKTLEFFQKVLGFIGIKTRLNHFIQKIKKQ
jgi:hypothetical protein